MTATPRFEDITETIGVPLSREGAEMLYTRYALAREIGAGRSVLELGCGLGFGLVGAKARLLIGADYSSALLKDPQRHCANRVPLTGLSAVDPCRHGWEISRVPGPRGPLMSSSGSSATWTCG